MSVGLLLAPQGFQLMLDADDTSESTVLFISLFLQILHSSFLQLPSKKRIKTLRSLVSIAMFDFHLQYIFIYLNIYLFFRYIF